MTNPTEIVLPDQLKHLVQYCEKNCVAECCGISAFDFSPLHVASYLSIHSGQISEGDVGRWEMELRKAEDSVIGLPLNEDGFICFVEAMNHYFTPSDFAAFIAELRRSLRVSPRIFEFSQQLRHERPQM